jgi:hypothetical protein
MGFFYASTKLLQNTEKQCVTAMQFVWLGGLLSSLHNKTQVMKTLITLIFVLVIGFTAQAQNPTELVKVKTITTTVVDSSAKQEIVINTENSVSVIFIYKNGKIKKALSFTTPKDKAILA